MVLAVGYLSMNWCRVDIPAVGLGASWDYAHATYLAIVHQHVRFQLADDYPHLDIAGTLGSADDGHDSKEESLLSDQNAHSVDSDEVLLAAAVGIGFAHH